MGRAIVQALPIQLSMGDDGVDGIIIYAVTWPDAEPPMYFMTKSAAERAATMERMDITGSVEEIIVWNDPIGDDRCLDVLRGA